MSMLAAARCLAQPYHSLESILRAVLRDEMIAWKKVGELWFCGVSQVGVACHSLESILRAVLRDEMIAWKKVGELWFCGVSQVGVACHSLEGQC